MNIKVINPEKHPMSSQEIKTWRHVTGLKHKHRPVFYSASSEKLGVRSPGKILNTKSKEVKSNMAYRKHKKRHNVAKKRYHVKHRRHNPVTKTVTFNPKRRHHVRRHRRHNPDMSNTTLNLTNITTMAAGAVIGGISVPWLLQIMALQGYMKYLAGLAFSLGGWYLLKKILPSAAVPFAAAGVGATALIFAKETNLLAGLGLGGDYVNANDLRNLEAARSAFLSTHPSTTMLGAYTDQSGYTKLPNVMEGDGFVVDQNAEYGSGL